MLSQQKVYFGVNYKRVSRFFHTCTPFSYTAQPVVSEKWNNDTQYDH